MKCLRIFAASPSDMATERTKVEMVASMLRPLAERVSVVLVVDDWGRALPGMGRAEKVILADLKPSSWDVFVGILWHRFGTPTAGRDAQTKEDYLGGTEEEFKTAYRLWQRCKRPRIMMYRCMRPIPPEMLDWEQFKRVEDFFVQFDAAKGTHPGLYQFFETTDSFVRLLHDNLQRLLLEYEGITGQSVSVRGLPNTAAPPYFTAPVHGTIHEA